MRLFVPLPLERISFDLLLSSVVTQNSVTHHGTSAQSQACVMITSVGPDRIRVSAVNQTLIMHSATVLGSNNTH